MCWNVRKKKKEEKVKVWRFGLMNNDWIINASQRMFLFFCSISFFFCRASCETWQYYHMNKAAFRLTRALCKKKVQLPHSQWGHCFCCSGLQQKNKKKKKTQDSLNRAQLDAKQSSIIWIYPALTHQIQADTPLDTVWLADAFIGLVGHTFAADEKSNMISFHRIGL